MNKVKLDILPWNLKVFFLLCLVLSLFQFGINMQMIVILGTVSKVQEALSNDIQKIIFLLCVAPIIEELIFRNFLLRGLLKRYSPNKSILLSSLLFAFVHANVANFNFHQIISAFIIGLFLGWIYTKSENSLGLVIVLHAFSNFIALVSPVLLADLCFYNFSITGHWLIVGTSFMGLYILLKYLNQVFSREH